jgi:hypothetical protein
VPARRRRRFVLAALCALAALGLGACANTVQDEPLQASFLEPLVTQAEYPVYWLGGSFHGLGLISVTRDPGGSYTLKYGDCRQGGENVCVTPLELVTSPDNSFRPGGAAPQQAGRVRGVAARLAQKGRTIVVATGTVVADVYAESAPLARAAAQAMVTIGSPQLPGAPLQRAQPDSGYAQKPLPSQQPPTAPLVHALAAR